jgi:radical SAM superfamily enzyme YgiQ (UPF0313 family)
VKQRRRARRVWVDLGDPGAFVSPAGPLERWQDHGLGLLRTVLHQAGVETDVLSVRSLPPGPRLTRQLARYDLVLMNVRSYTFPIAADVARAYKRRRPTGTVLVGGMHATVAPEEMEAETSFDHIVRGPAEGNIVELVQGVHDLPRVTDGRPAASMADWPLIDRTLWPRPRRKSYPWPLEPACGWGPPPVATVITSRVCPWRCAFCNESAYIPALERRPVDLVIDELNHLDEQHGPLGSVVIHDSMFFQQPVWLREWLAKYPKRARRVWPYWAAARSDTVRLWPDLFEALVRETNWNTVSIGFESGSDAVLRTLNKECTTADHAFTIDLLNRIGDDLEAQGKAPPRFWANVMLGIPGESREDAFATLRMLRRMRHALPSTSFYAPYPGSGLGHQLIAEGRSRMTGSDYHRYPSDEKVVGIDYAFLRELLAGAHDDEVDRRPWPDAAAEPSARGLRSNTFFLFEVDGGGTKLGYGADPDDALATLALRLGAAEMATIRRDRWTRVTQRELLTHRHELT